MSDDVMSVPMRGRLVAEGDRGTGWLSPPSPAVIHHHLHSNLPGQTTALEPAT